MLCRPKGAAALKSAPLGCRPPNTTGYSRNKKVTKRTPNHTLWPAQRIPSFKQLAGLETNVTSPIKRYGFNPARLPNARKSHAMSPRKIKQPLKSKAGDLIKKLRKPLAPPTRVVPDESKYSRARERELAHRTIKQ